MLPLSSYLDFLAWLFELASRVRSLWPTLMYGRRARLSSIAERSEAEEEATVTKWVPKQKHEVLKAKYKCMKKLFQVYDASLVSMLPEPYVQPDTSASRETKESAGSHRSTKKKRKTHRRKESSKSSDSDKGCGCAAGALMKDLKMKKCTLGPTLTDQVGIAESTRQFSNVKSIKAESSDLTSETSLCANDNLNYTRISQCAMKQPAQQFASPVQQMFYQPLKLTTMQMLKYRLFGRRPKKYRCNMGEVHSQSDPTMLCWGASPSPAAATAVPRPRRRLLRLRRHRANRTGSCDCLVDPGHPIMLKYSQSVQQNCLLDNTVRQCPFPGCNMQLNGIINYNDHLRLCHFPARKFGCHYCHEGFETEQEKLIHENEHIGIFNQWIKSNTQNNFKKNKKIISDHDKDVQCDVIQEHKLTKIVSYFDKISLGDGCFVKNPQPCCSKSDPERKCNRLMRPEKSCIQFNSCKESFPNSGNSDRKTLENISIACKTCGDPLRFRQELSSHMDNRHGKTKSKQNNVSDFPLKKSPTFSDGELNVNSIENGNAVSSSSDGTIRARRKHLDETRSALSLDYDPSTNIVYYNTTSMESICKKKSSFFAKFVEKAKSVRSLPAPKWEQSNTTVIHI